jgi:hypothetical protein
LSGRNLLDTSVVRAVGRGADTRTGGGGSAEKHVPSTRAFVRLRTRVVGDVMKTHKGQVEAADVKRIVEELLK